MNINYVDSRTPEEREADSKIETTVTTASAMTNTDKILELKEMLDDPRTGLKDSSNTNKTRYGILALFETAIAQALAEERERVRERVGELTIYRNNKGVTEIEENTGYYKANEITSSLDKPIDKPKSMWGGPGCGYMMGPGSILDLSGGGSGYGTCGNCGGVVDEPLSSLDKIKEI